MTYNVHGCRGGDRKLNPGRILEVIGRGNPDVVALQELDIGQRRSNGLDQAAFFAQRLRMELHFVSARECGGGHYGNAILSRLPSEAMASACLPRVGESFEPRAAQWVRVDAPWGELDIFNVHLSLNPRERLLQARALLDEPWLGDPRRSQWAVLCGDLNAMPGSPAYTCLSVGLDDAQRRSARAHATFPAFFPIVRLDHVFVTGGLEVDHVEVGAGALARVASDHRPLSVVVRPRAGGIG
jgi:endonuclease/exonuclease/phosphatase family metal-dependent hydrolase